MGQIGLHLEKALRLNGISIIHCLARRLSLRRSQRIVS
jgi:hypothetical protein